MVKKNEFYYLESEDKNILMTKDALPSDRIMDSAQILICKTLGEIDSTQQVLNTQKIKLPIQGYYQRLHTVGS